MRQVEVYRNGVLAGLLTEQDRYYFVFQYDNAYFTDNKQRAVSLTLPKTKKEYSSEFLFPFFFNLLSEGANRKLQCNYWKIDESDHFGLLTTSAQYDTIGAITVKPVETK